MRKIIYVLIITLLIGSLLISSYFILKINNEDREQEEIYENIQEITQKNNEKEDNEKENINMDSLYHINNDIVGWIRIDDTQINFPVMQTKDRLNYYLRKDFYDNYSQWGTPYISENCDIETSDNLIIYGHHIKNYKMFGELEKYKEKEYYEKHKIIKFYTMEKSEKYEIIFVFTTTVYDNKGFKYYQYYNLSSKSEFDTFINKCKELSIYSTNNAIEYGDKFLTLSTCEYSRTNGRLVVVAKKI